MTVKTGGIRGPGIFLAQFLAAEAPFDTLANQARWAASLGYNCLLYTSPSPRDVEESRMPSSA